MLSPGKDVTTRLQHELHPTNELDLQDAVDFLDWLEANGQDAYNIRFLANGKVSLADSVA
jgi:hypothetical protein